MDFKAILFDLDGTLLDSVPTIMKCNKEVFDVMELPFDSVDVRNCIGIPLKVQALRFAGERATEFMDRYRSVYLQHQEQLFPGTSTMLDALKSRNYLTGLVTSKAANGVLRITKQTGIFEKFDVIVTADDIKNPKPHPEPILKALKKLNVATSAGLYVGDSLFDVDAANSANVQMAAVSWGARSKGDLLLMCPDRVFDTWEEFLNWLARKSGLTNGRLMLY